MNLQSKNWQAAALAALTVMISGCTQRTILHGMHGRTSKPVAVAKVEGTFNVWFVKAAGGGLALVPVARKSIAGDRLKESVQQLLQGPTQSEEGSGLGTEIPRGTLLLSFKRQGGDVELNLSRRFAMSGGATSFETRLQQLRKTVAQTAASTKVYLNVEGKRLNIEEGEGIEIPQPLNSVASVGNGNSEQ